MNLQLVFYTFVLISLPLALVFEQNIPSLIIKFLSFFPLTIALIYLCVFLHELGHYVFLIYFKVKVEIFQVGHGDIVFKYQKNSSKTIFQLGSKAVGGKNKIDMRKHLKCKKLFLIYYGGLLFNKFTILLCAILAHTFYYLNPNSFGQHIGSLLFLYFIFLFLTSFSFLILGRISLYISMVTICSILTIILLSTTNATPELSSFFESILLNDFLSNEFYKYCIFYFTLIFTSMFSAYAILISSLPNTEANITFERKIKQKVKEKRKEKIEKGRDDKTAKGHIDGTIIYFLLLKIHNLQIIHKVNKWISPN